MHPGDVRAYAVIGRMLGAGLWMLAGVLLAALLWFWERNRQPEPLPVSVPVLAQPAKALATVEHVMAPCETVRVYKPPAKKRLKLPAAIQADPAAHVVAASDVPAGEHDTRVSTVLNTQTGAVETFAELQPLPWLRARSDFSLGAYVGLKPGHPGPVGRVEAHYDLLQVKALGLGAIASLDTDGTAFVGIGGRF